MNGFPMRHAAAALLLAGLGACAAPPASGPFAGNAPYVGATLPADSVQGAGDPTRSAIISSAYSFGNPASLAGRPAEAARALANLEYLAAEIPRGARWREFNPIAGLELERARTETRAAIGIAPQAAPQQVIDGFYAASRALAAGDSGAAQRILSPPVFNPGGAATLQRLANLPPLPAAARATSLTASELDRSQREGRSRGGDGGGGGGFR